MGSVTGCESGAIKRCSIQVLGTKALVTLVPLRAMIHSFYHFAFNGSVITGFFQQDQPTLFFNLIFPVLILFANPTCNGNLIRRRYRSSRCFQNLEAPLRSTEETTLGNRDDYSALVIRISRSYTTLVEPSNRRKEALHHCHDEEYTPRKI